MGVRSDVGLLYRRAGFGLTGDQMEAAASGGYEAAVETLLEGVDGTPAPDPGPVSITGLRQWWLQLMISTTKPLAEKLALFWHGHFATGIAKVRDPRLMYLQNQLFRTGGAGSFEDLVGAVARDGAMMFWLDTVSNLKSHPNENFAREMMELFTLGIGNYTQADVDAGARAFTGWSYSRAAYRYFFRARQHDFATKTYLGATGDWNGTDAVHIAVGRPESARFVLAALWSHFAYPVTPADPMLDDLLPAYGSGSDLRAALRAVFLHPGFRSPASRGGLVKQPAEYLAGAARALGLDATPQMALWCAGMGQSLFAPPNVGGWGQNTYWLDTASAQYRLLAATEMATRADLSAVEVVAPAQRPSAAARLLGIDSWGPTTAGALARVSGSPQELVALALVSPEYVVA